jgi:hypothetical protein
VPPNVPSPWATPASKHRKWVRASRIIWDDEAVGQSSATIVVGETYEDCFFNPCLCTYAQGDDLEGISLIDGSVPRGCSQSLCGVSPLTLAEALKIKEYFREYVELRTALDLDPSEVVRQLP